MKYKIGIDKRDYWDISFIIFTILSIIAPSTVHYDISIVIFVSFSLIKTINQKIIYRNKYFVFELLFLIFTMVQALFINDSLLTEHIGFVRLFWVSLFFNYFLFIYISNRGYKRVFGNYIFGSIIAFCILMVFYTSSLFIFNFDASNEVDLFFITLGGASSTYLAWIISIVLILSMLLFFESKKSNYRFAIFFSTLILLLTGRRKTLIFLFAAFGCGYFFSNKSIIKKSKYIIITLISLAVVYICISEIPYLYETLGVRVINAISYVLQGIVPDDSSIRSRVSMNSSALILWENSKLIGHGFGSFRYITSRSTYSHNNYMELLVGNGLIGLVLYYSKYVYLLYLSLVRYIKSKNWVIEYLAALLIVFMVLELWQITVIYRNLTLLLIFILGYLNDKNINRN